MARRYQMSKVNDIMQARNEGIAYAYRMVSEQGLEALRKEVEFRNISGISIIPTKGEMKAKYEHMAMHATVVAISTAIVALKEEFEFSDYQAIQFKRKFDEKIQECLADSNKLTEFVTKVEMIGIKLLMDY